MTRPQAIQTAREMWAGGQGWKITEIRDYLAGHGHDMCWETVRGWADPEWKQRERDRMRSLQRHRKRAQSGSLMFRIQDDDARQRLAREYGGQIVMSSLEVTPELLLALRVEDGLTYTAIAAVARRFLGEDMTPDQWRYQLTRIGAPKNERKAAHARAQARPRRLENTDRRTVILERWRAGVTVRAIAFELGVSPGTVAGEMHRMRAAGFTLPERPRGRRPKAVAA